MKLIISINVAVVININYPRQICQWRWQIFNINMHSTFDTTFSSASFIMVTPFCIITCFHCIIHSRMSDKKGKEKMLRQQKNRLNIFISVFRMNFT